MDDTTNTSDLPVATTTVKVTGAPEEVAVANAENDAANNAPPPADPVIKSSPSMLQKVEHVVEEVIEEVEHLGEEAVEEVEDLFSSHKKEEADGHTDSNSQ